MKAFFLVFSMVGFCYFFAYAQHKGKEAKYKRFSLPNIDLPLQDSLQKRKPVNLDSYIQKGDNSVAIPNVYTKKEEESYAMSVKKLNGKGLAPMPGTENLDKIDLKGQPDSLKFLGKYKK